MTPRILCYHALSPTWNASLSVLPSSLERHAAMLRRRGFVGLTVTSAERLRGQGRLPERTVVFTFDDAYSSTLLALPILRAYGFPATVFVPTGFVDAARPLAWAGTDRWVETPHGGELAPATWDVVRSLVDAGWEAGSHTVTHPHLTQLDDASLQRELELSRAAIEREVGSCTSIAYPYGDADARVIAAARAAGYMAGVVLARSTLPSTPLSRPRVAMYHKDNGWREQVKLSRGMIALQRMRAGAAAALFGGNGAGFPAPRA